MRLLVDDRLGRRHIGLRATAEGIAQTGAGFMQIDALVTTWTAIGVIAEHIAGEDMAETVADIGLQVAGQIDRRTGHQAVGEAPLAAAVMFEARIAIARVAGFAAGIAQLVPPDLRAADAGARRKA